MAAFENKHRRIFFRNALLGFVPDLLIAWAVAASNQSDQLFLFFLTLIGLQVLYLALWTKRSIWSWLMFWVSNRSTMAEHVEQYLISNGFPAPPKYMAGPDDYFTHVANDEEEQCSMRVKAAVEFGTFAGIAACNQHQLLFQMKLATEDGIQRYAKYLGPKGPRKESLAKSEVPLSLPKHELDTLAWLADIGFRVMTAPTGTYRRSMEQIPYARAAAYASLIDKFERRSVSELLAEDEEEKARRFDSHENRQHVLRSSYPNSK